MRLSPIHDLDHRIMLKIFPNLVSSIQIVLAILDTYCMEISS